jgi:hypothetical protein
MFSNSIFFCDSLLQGLVNIDIEKMGLQVGMAFRRLSVIDRLPAAKTCVILNLSQ